MLLNKVINKIRRVLGNTKASIIILFFNLKIFYKSKIEIYSFRKSLSKYGISDLKAFHVESWHTNFYYFTGKIDGITRYIKCSNDKDRMDHEIEIIRNLSKFDELEGKFPKVINYINANKYYYLVEELYSYKPLSTVISTDKISDRIKENIICKIIWYIEFFIEKGFIHADLRPENFFYDSTNEDLYIIDFGFSFFSHDSTKGAFNYLNSKEKRYLLSSLNSEFSLEPYYFDDAYSALKICTALDTDFYSKFNNYWLRINSLCGKLTYQETFN